MKATLFVIAILVGGYAYYLQTLNRGLVVEVGSLSAKVDHLEEQAEKLKKDLKDRDAALKAALEVPVIGDRSSVNGEAMTTAAAAPVVPVIGDRSSVNGEAKTTAPAVPVVDVEAQRRAKRMAEIEARLLFLESERARGEAARANAAANPPVFSEQGDRVDGFGRVIGKKGVRTSDADRAKALEAHNQRIAAMDARLAEIAAEVAGLEAERGKIMDE